MLYRYWYVINLHYILYRYIILSGYSQARSYWYQQVVCSKSLLLILLLQLFLLSLKVVDVYKGVEILLKIFVLKRLRVISITTTILSILLNYSTYDFFNIKILAFPIFSNKSKILKFSIKSYFCLNI